MLRSNRRQRTHDRKDQIAVTLRSLCAANPIFWSDRAGWTHECFGPWHRDDKHSPVPGAPDVTEDSFDDILTESARKV